MMSKVLRCHERDHMENVPLIAPQLVFHCNRATCTAQTTLLYQPKRRWHCILFGRSEL